MLQISKATKVVGNGPHEKKVLLNKVDLTLQPGEFVTVVGGNGAGKSTSRLQAGRSRSMSKMSPIYRKKREPAIWRGSFRTQKWVLHHG